MVTTPFSTLTAIAAISGFDCIAFSTAILISESFGLQELREIKPTKAITIAKIKLDFFIFSFLLNY